MKTYHKGITPQKVHSFLWKTCLLLLLLLPVSLWADDDCAKLYKKAKSYAEKEVKTGQDKAADAETAYKAAQEALEQAKKALQDFDNPGDGTAHGTDYGERRKELERAVARAEEQLQQAKSDYYDALVELIKRLTELERQLKAAEEQCGKEKEETERESELEKLEALELDLADLRDEFDLEERPDEPKEPENTTKKKDDLVKEELDALLKTILDELKAANPEPEDYRRALREKIKEILKWKDGFWKTPLGKLLKELLKKALEAELNPPAELPDEDSSLPGSYRDTDGAYLHHKQPAFSLGVNLGFRSSGAAGWCWPGGQDLSAEIFTTDLLVHQSTLSAASDVSTAHTAHLKENPLPQDQQPALLCLEKWSSAPYYGLFLEHGAGRFWAVQLGGGFSRQRAVSRQETGASGPPLTAQIREIELYFGLSRHFGQGVVQPLIGLRGVYQMNSGRAVFRNEEGEVRNEAYWKGEQFGLQGYAGFQFRLHPRLDLRLLGQWDHFFRPGDPADARGLHIQLNRRF